MTKNTLYYHCDLCHCGFAEKSTLDAHICYPYEFTTKDSGERQHFDSGMVRDSKRSKVRYDLVYMPMLKRWAELMGRGAEKYGDNNWLKANSEEELNRFKESAIRHFYQWFNDENPEEDHCAAIVFNLSGAEYVKEKLWKDKENTSCK